MIKKPASPQVAPPMVWQTRMFLSAIPLGVLLIAIGLAHWMLSRPTLMALYGLLLLIVPTGKFIILAPVLHGTLPFSPFFIASLVLLIDSCIAWFVMLNLTALYTLPWVGNGLRSIEASGRMTLDEHPWMRRMAMLGVVVFVALPIPGTGAIGGTIVARLIGLGLARSIAIILIGTMLGAYGVALGAHTLLVLLPPQPSNAWLGMMRLGIIVLIILLLSWLGQRGKVSRGKAR